ncbi:MAG TPA: FAD-linked oxidase C-terminal domain-containing protein, partial [Gemmatimonadaceae bacterium]|nr:FAD-linked oxidase C-terminal domain-containing protein [Gemmatimonadaceae bacterium]
GHAGDAHAHVNPLIDVDAPGWRDVVGGLLDDVTALVAELGGTLAAEHGDGRLRTPLLDRVHSGRTLDAIRLVKDAMDPAGLLNPGVKIPALGQPAIGDIKYDPTLPPLPPRAQAALRHVERHRAYARSRLELLDSPE